MKKMKNFLVSILIALFMLLAFLCPIYFVCFSHKVSSKNVVNEIVSMRIDSCNIFYGSKTITSDYYNKKYHIEIFYDKFVPFEQVSDTDIFIKNYSGDIIVSNSFNNMFSKDQKKLLRFLEIEKTKMKRK